MKTAIITSGGGMRCAYSAGALATLANDFHITDPDLFISVSGSVGTMFCYLARQYDHGKKIWYDFLPSSKLIRYFPRPTIDVDYLVDTVFKEKFPLDEKALAENATKWIVPVADLKTGMTRFITSESWFNPYEVMRAAKAVLFLYRKSVRLGSIRALDGDLTTDIEDLIVRAVAEGATRILVITNMRPPTKLIRAAVRVRSLFSGKNRRKILNSFLAPEDVFEYREGVRIMFLTPSEPITTWVAASGPEVVHRMYELGQHDALRKRVEIEKLFA